MMQIVDADGPDLLDRADEREAIDRVIATLHEGLSGVYVLVGDAGMGKTRLLEYAAASASQQHTVWIAGVEAEQELGYAGLHRLLRPYLNRLERLPEPQRAALESAFGLGVAAPADRFLVGLACLSLLAEVAGEQGMLCIVDDAQWLDRESLDALAFVARRLEADRIALLFGARVSDAVAGVLAGLPTLTIGGLPEDASLELLSASVDIAVDPDTARRVVHTTAGCPLALVELAVGLSPEQLRRGYTDGDVLPIGQRLEDHYLRQVRELDSAAQVFILVAAVESSGDPVLVRRAAFRLGADEDAEDTATRSGLITIRGKVEFRHPLVRAAVYAGVPRSLRDSVHETLADLIGRSDPDRQVRHLAAAAREPDAALAEKLDQAGQRARRRGSYAAEASFMLEAAQLSPTPDDRARRMLRAATAALNAGLLQRAEALLEQARAGLQDAALTAEAMHLDGRLRTPLADPPSAPVRLLAAARALEPIDPLAAREAMVEALEACIVAQTFTVGVELSEVARAALASGLRSSDAPTLEDLLLEGTALLFVPDYGRALPVLRDAARIMREKPVSREEFLRYYTIGLSIVNELWDDSTYAAWVARVEECARATGALITLQVVLLGRAKQETRLGDFAAAERTYDEVVELTRLMGGPPEFYELLKVDLYAWRGQEHETRAAVAPLRSAAATIGSASVVNISDLALATLELGRADYAGALAAIDPLVSSNQVGWTCLGLTTAIEAAARSGDAERAAAHLADLSARATATGTNWARGQLARSRAIVAGDDSGAEPLYREAIELLERTTIDTELAQAHLSFGEWLRRQKRRVDARSHLGTAYESFAAMGAEGFGMRARKELEATGERIARRSLDTATALTPQEAHIARLAADRATNAEIAARMFISANTVDYHLRKVYRKLGISSRRELAGALPPPDPRGAERRGA